MILNLKRRNSLFEGTSPADIAAWRPTGSTGDLDEFTDVVSKASQRFLRFGDWLIPPGLRGRRGAGTSPASPRFPSQKESEFAPRHKEHPA